MAFNHITQISQNLAKLEWLTDDWVKEEVGKNANKRGRQQVATHIARQFAVVPNPRDLKRIQCSSIADGEELRYLAQVWVNKDGITETRGHRCEHIASLLLIASLFKNHFKKQPGWTKAKLEEGFDLNNLTEEQRAAGVGLSWPNCLYAWTLQADAEMPYDLDEGENGAPAVPAVDTDIPVIMPPYDRKDRRKRSAYSMNRKRALLHVASAHVQEGGIGRWALDHFSPELLAKLLGERPTTLLSKICQHITEDEIVAFEIGMQDEIHGFDDRVDEMERVALEESRNKKQKTAEDLDPHALHE